MERGEVPMRSSSHAFAAVLALTLAGASFAGPPQDKPVPPGQAKADSVPPPGQAKRGGLPPGLAKKFGEDVPEKAWIAFQPGRDDGAWFLIDGQWTLMAGFPSSLRLEVKEARKRPAAVPPVPPPNVGVALHVVLFE
jgi:hypothetical protein